MILLKQRNMWKWKYLFLYLEYEIYMDRKIIQIQWF